MTVYLKKQFGKELASKIAEGFNNLEISKWAFSVYIEHGLNFENGLDYDVLKLVAMEEGPEFALAKEELCVLAKELTNEK